MKKSCFLFLLLTLSFISLNAQDTKENAEFKLAINFYNEGFYDLAISQLRKFIESYPNSPQVPEAQFYLGMSYFKIKKFEDAQSILQNFAISYPSHPKAIEALWRSAECFVEMKRYKEAGISFERIKIFHPKSSIAPKSLLEASKYFELASDFQNAKKVLVSLIQEYPESEHYYTARFKYAEILTKEENKEKALIEYQKIAKEAEDRNLRYKANLNIAKIHASIGKSEEAERQLLQIISQPNLDPEIIISAYFELAKIQAEFGEYENAIEYMQNARILLSTFIDKELEQKILLQLANFYFNIADYHNAIKFYNELLTSISESTQPRDLYLSIAMSLDKILNYKKANEFYLKVIHNDTLTPETSIAIINLANNFIRLGNFDKAIEFFKKYIELFPSSNLAPHILLQIAEIYKEKLKDYQKAIHLYTDLLNRFPKNQYVDEALYRIALCYVELGEIEKAISSLEELVKNYTSSELYGNALNDIEKLKKFKLTDQASSITIMAELIADILKNKPRSETLIKLADFYNYNLKDYSKALTYYNLALSDGNLSPQTILRLQYKKVICAYNLSLENKIKPDSAVNIINNFLLSKPEIESEKIDTVILYLYRLLTQGSTQEIKREIAEDFKSKYPTSKFYSIFVLDILSFNFENQRWNEVIKLATDNFNRFDRNQAPEVLYKRAYGYYKIGERQKSLADIDLILQSYSPSQYDAKALELKAKIYEEIKNYAEAINLWQKLMQDFFYTNIAKDARLKIADLYFRAGDYLKAIREYEKYLSEDISLEKNPEVIFKIASAYNNLGNLADAKRYYKIYLSTPKTSFGQPLQERLPNAGKAFYALGNIYKIEGMPKKAVYYLEKVGKFDASLGRKAILESADLLFEEEKYEEALRNFSEALKNAENDNSKMAIQAKMIICYYRMNDVNNASKLVNSFKQTFSKFDLKNYLAEFQLELGGYYFRNREISSAKKVFEEIVKNYPDSRFSFLARYWLAKIDEYNGNIQLATKTLLELNRKPIDRDTRLRVNFSLGNIYFKLEKHDSATIYYRFVVENADKPQTLQLAMNNLLACYEELGYYELAIELARRYIDKFPNAEDLVDKKIKIGILYQMLGNYDLALAYFQRLLEEVDKEIEPEIRYYIGEVLYNKGEYEQAILEFLKVPYLTTKKTKIDWTANAFYMAGQSYEKMKKYEQAINMYQQIIDRPGIDPIFKSGAQKEIERIKAILKK